MIQMKKIMFDQYFDKYIKIDYIRKIEYVPFICRFLSNKTIHHEVHEATGNDIRLNVLQEYHVVTA